MELRLPRPARHLDDAEISAARHVVEGADPANFPLRIETPAGISNILLFSLGTFPEVTEEESQPYSPPNRNDSIETAEPLRASPIVVNGTLRESWRGLPKDVTIANWNGGKSAASLKWFADRGHGQIIAGYYDSDLSSFRRWHAAAKGVPRVTGFMYTTWQQKYEHLEAYGKAMMGKE